MRFFIIGAGVIGSTYSWLLQEAGYQTMHYVRSKKLGYYKQKGILIDCLDGRQGSIIHRKRRFRPEFTDQIKKANDYNYVLVSVNSEKLKPVLQLLYDNQITTNILFMQNIRMNDYRQLNRYLDKNQYLFAYPFITGGGIEDNIIKNSIFGYPICHTKLGEPDGRKTTRLMDLYRVFKQIRMHPSYSKDIITYQKLHYVWAGCTAAAYLCAPDYETFIQEDEDQIYAYQTMRRVWKVFEAEGLYAKRMLPYIFFYAPMPLLIPISKWFYRSEQSQRMVQGHVDHSKKEMKVMIQDIFHEVFEDGKIIEHKRKYSKYENVVMALEMLTELR